MNPPPTIVLPVTLLRRRPRSLTLSVFATGIKGDGLMDAGVLAPEKADNAFTQSYYSVVTIVAAHYYIKEIRLLDELELSGTTI